MKVGILGAGKLGRRVTEALLDGDYDVTIVDTNEDKLNQISQQFDVMAVNGDAKTVEVLKEIGVKNMDFLFSCTTSDDTNIIAAQFAKSLGCKYVAARVRDPEHMNQIDYIRETCNIDMLVNPDLLITGEIYRYLIEKYTLSNGIYTFSRIGLIEFEAYKKPEIVGCSLVEFRNAMPNFLMVGIARNGKMIIPHGSDIIQRNDLVYLMGEKKDVFALDKQVHSKLRKNDARKVMIVGGGKTGYCFYHLTGMKGDETQAEMTYIIRDHDMKKFLQKKERVRKIADYLNDLWGEDTVEIALRDSYYNMREKIEKRMEVVERAMKALKAEGLSPAAVPIRGGTDGARLTDMGLPCPNLGTGGCCGHGVHEHLSVDEMEKMVGVLKRLVSAE